MWKKVLVGILILGIVIVGFGFFKNKQSASTEVNLLQVKTLPMEPESLETIVNADGTVITKLDKEIKSRISGTVVDVFVTEGDRVLEGEKLISIDDQEIQKALTTSRLNYAEAEQNYEKLVKRFNSQDQENQLKLADAKDNIAIAKSSLKKEELSLENQRIVAEKRITTASEQLAKVEKEYLSMQSLFAKGAIAEKDLNQLRETIEQTKEELENAQKDLKVLTEETIPTSLELAHLKVGSAENQLKLLENSIDNSKVTQSDLQLSKLRMEIAAQTVAELEDQLQKVVTYSPITGTVIGMTVKKGDKIMEGVTIGTVADLANLRVEAWVDEIHINQVTQGQSVVISGDAFDEELTGKVLSIAPVATRQGNINRFKVELQLTSDTEVLRPGMFVNTEIRTNYRELALCVPPLTILGDEEQYVFVLREGQAEKRVVETGLRTLTKVEITTGVQSGEKVIVGPYPILKSLKPGTAVLEIIEPEAINQ